LSTRIPTAIGNLVEFAGILFAVYLILIAPEVASLTVKLVLYLVAWGCMEFFPRGLTHYLVGRLVGVKFRYYSLGKSAAYKLKTPFLGLVTSRLPVLTLNVDRKSLRSVGRSGRFAMFSSGAISSMILPFIVAFGSFRDLPLIFSALLLFLSAANFAFDLYFSPKVGDISRAVAASETGR